MPLSLQPDEPLREPLLLSRDDVEADRGSDNSPCESGAQPEDEGASIFQVRATTVATPTLQFPT
jgi:hypothetical protein